MRVGVTGHRLERLADTDLTALAEASHDVLALVGAQSPHAPPRHLISSLADGADSIIGHAALALGWRLDCVLPLPRDDYAADFAPSPTLNAYDRRIAAANAVFELPHMEHGADQRTAAYERAGRVMLAPSDIVIQHPSPSDCAAC